MLNIKRQKWGEMGAGGWGVGGRWKLACFLKPYLCSYTWRSYPTHTWNSHLKHDCPRERRLWQPFPNYIPNLEPKSLPERELKARRTEIIPALLCFFFLKKKKTKNHLAKQDPIIVLIIILSVHYWLLIIGLHCSPSSRIAKIFQWRNL